MPIERTRLIGFLRNSSLFRDLPNEQLDYVIVHLEEMPLEPDQEVYAQGSGVGSLYLIFEGRVKLVKEEAKGPVMTMAAGDVFGLESLSAVGRRRTGATATQKGLILVFTAQALDEVVRSIPHLQARLTLRYESFLLALAHPFKWLEKDETVFFMSRYHPLFLMIKIIIPMGLLLIDLAMLAWTYLSFGAEPVTLSILMALAFLFVVITGWNYVDWSNDYSIITNQRVVFQEKVIFFYDTRREVRLNAIRSVDVRQSQMGLIFGYADIIVRIFAGDIFLPRIRFAKDVAQFLDEQRRRMIIRQSAEDKEKFKEELHQRITHVEQPPLPPPPAPATSRRRRPPAYLGDTRTRYHMRFEKNGVVTYRTHIIHLLGRTLTLFIILIVVLSLVVSSFVTRPSLIVNPDSMKFILIFYGLLVLGLVGVIWYRVEDWRNDIYVITETQIIDRNKKPLGREEVRTTSFERIDAVRFEQKGIWALIFNYGTVYVRVGQSELTFDNVARPSDVQREILGAMAKRDYSQRQETMRQERERIADWMEAYYDLVDRPETEEDSTG